MDIHASEIPIPLPLLMSLGEILEAIHMILQPNNREGGIEIPQAWMHTIKKRNNRKAVKKQTAEGTVR